MSAVTDREKSQDEKSNDSTEVHVQDPETDTQAGSRTTDADNRLLAKLGYRSEFRREFSLFESIAFAYAIMGPVAGASSTLGFGLSSGGHVGIVWGWLIPCCFVLTIAASMAELTSSMPTSAGLYYFSAKMASPRHSALASWITGWSNIVGQVTLVCSIDFTAAQYISVALFVGSDGAINLGTGAQYGILWALVLLHGVVSSFWTRLLARLNIFYALLNLGTSIAVIAVLSNYARTDGVSSHVAFTKYENTTGWSNNGWAFCLSFLSSMWTLTGYDSAAHVSEETANASRAAPRAIFAAVLMTMINGWLILIAASFAIVSVPDLLSSPLPLPMAQLLLNVVGKHGMLTLWSLILLVLFMAGASQTVDASRVVYAFARDNALPGSRYWRRVNTYTQTPVNAAWFVVFCAGICGLVGFSNAALSSLAGASTIGLYISYATPIFCRITSGRNRLKPGPFSLGAFAVPVGAIAVAWVAFVTVVLMFPSSSVPSAENMNYAVVIIVGILGLAGVWWVLSARKWFKGPVPNIDSRGETEGKGYAAEA
ncbi:amino acid transporter [Neolentinus lepideus HHB14362 ss-1]|uniref:Amino acid transporter n=1 Tax=Neolentinus lepideus HHB14362 ss-1 TaxID=1314782 RepID=A0A165VSI8_9AGAM|nr:amino acid transporter [Neolentinus lepideus HHB14362 ss-1]